ncbi:MULTISPECIES: ABC transporter ATP-binding protein [unclassified Leucobacter]|uniref:ABC transporter ATP-binding protein n=1 Tax=unclassified Leucobacter TaxID=2621730 RepID=UPI00165D8DAE|nr:MULTISPECIES: ABC transporter ATP-binding protein [unclassified Leucobacter]MBC9935931.1 ABC transporter ATP-binding protein [Leucobacter sp. cx-87]
MTAHTAPGGAAIEAIGLSKRYGARTVLDEVSLEIPTGETFALLGPNGAGKSTTIGILTGVVRPSSGSVHVLGNDPVAAGRAWRARIGIVTQTSGDTGPYTVAELVRHYAALYPNPRDSDVVIEAVGLAERRDVRVTKLSGGQQRRVDVALGIVGNPEVLFLDEPTTGFDPEARHQFWGLIESLKADGTTILLTTHYLEEAARLADRAGVISGGRLVAIDTVDRIGGPLARVPRVRWRGPEGQEHDERTQHPGELVARLVETHGGEPPELEVIRPSLEDIYLDLIGEDRATQLEGNAA